MFEALKSLLRDQLGVAPWLVLMTVGLTVHLAANVLSRRSATSPFGLLAPLALGLAIEAIEVWQHYGRIGLFAQGNDPPWRIAARHGRDVVVMLALPLALVLAARLRL